MLSFIIIFSYLFYAFTGKQFWNVINKIDHHEMHRNRVPQLSVIWNHEEYLQVADLQPKYECKAAKKRLF